MLRVTSRPLSPFWIYRWLITNSLSITHRATGLLLTLGLIVLVIWLALLAGGSESYAGAVGLFSSPWFKVPLVVWTTCFFYHVANGVRHLFFDGGYGFEREQIRRSGWTVVAFAVIASLLYFVFVII